MRLTDSDLDDFFAPDEVMSLQEAAERGDMSRFAEVWFIALKRIAHSGQPGSQEMVLKMLTEEGKRKMGLSDAS